MNELTISLDPHRKTPLYEQIYGFIREEIRGGRIRAGERLPSARALSGYLSVSRSTVDLAYEQLVSEGYLESVPCKGYFVCEIEGLYRLDEKKEETKEDDAAEQMPFRYDFAVTGTAPGGFPQNSWKKISKEVLLDADDSLFQLGDAKGEHGLREAIRDYLHHARGVNCRTEQIIVGAGNDYLLMLLSVILGRGHKVAMENPTYISAYRCFAKLGYAMCTISMDEAGMRPDFAGKRVLDLGCGYGWHCIYAAEHGAAAVTGVDLSEKMLAVAREKTTAPQVTYIRGDMAETPFPPESFDVVLSSLAIHYLPSFTDFLERVRQCLSPGGDFVFSVEHPIFTAAGPQEWYYGPDGTPLHFPVDRYFEEGRRTARFLGEDVTKYHRTLTTYLDGLLTGGFQLLRVVEPQPPARMLGQPGMRDELRRPMMLLVSARKRTAWPHGKPGRRDGPG